jgi:hypothetical protein
MELSTEETTPSEDIWYLDITILLQCLFQEIKGSSFVWRDGMIYNLPHFGRKIWITENT